MYYAWHYLKQFFFCINHCDCAALMWRARHSVGLCSRYLFQIGNCTVNFCEKQSTKIMHTHSPFHIWSGNVKICFVVPFSFRFFLHEFLVIVFYSCCCCYCLLRVALLLSFSFHFALFFSLFLFLFRLFRFPLSSSTNGKQGQQERQKNITFFSMVPRAKSIK